MEIQPKINREIMTQYVYGGGINFIVNIIMLSITKATCGKPHYRTNKKSYRKAFYTSILHKYWEGRLPLNVSYNVVGIGNHHL